MTHAMLLLILSAQAGKLADGFRGLPFGDAAVLDQAPLDDCRPSPEPAVRWTCTTTINTAPVSVSYLAKEGLFYGVFMATDGYTNYQRLRGALIGAYGRGHDASPRLDLMWTDGPVHASIDRNQFTDRAIVIISHERYATEADKREAARDAASASDL